ncbi:hypothetical protein ACFV2X_41155 [Streptomyces sp. NPDC059679]|uniref:hypothetical protein n=1 Tax=Streptomyces sp. NPDC059679 TaxID=3346903 RepID=UPI0036B9557E
MALHRLRQADRLTRVPLPRCELAPTKQSPRQHGLVSGFHELTTVGTYTEMVSRLGEPVLLGLAALAIRGRVKR